MDIWDYSSFYLHYISSVIYDYIWPEDDFEFILLGDSPFEVTLI